MRGRKYYKVVAAIAAVVVIAGALWFASPVADTAISANNEGLVYNNEGDYQKAIVAFTKAIELDPSLANAYSNRGWAYIKLGQYEQAIADCTKAIELDPSLAIAYNYRGWAHIKSGQHEQATADYDKAAELDPSFRK